MFILILLDNYGMFCGLRTFSTYYEFLEFKYKDNYNYKLYELSIINNPKLIKEK